MSYQRSHDVVIKEGIAVDLLPADFEPGDSDVICQRGKECYDHEGNRRFRAAIERNSANYCSVENRKEKSSIVSEIVAHVRKASKETSSIGGGFVRKELLSRRWYRVNDKIAREKAGQALRDIIKAQRASGKKRDRGQGQNLDQSCSDDSSSSDQEEEESSFSQSEKRPRPGDWATSTFEENLPSISTRSIDASNNLLPHPLPFGQGSSLFELLASTGDYSPHPSPHAANNFFDFKLASELEPTPIISKSMIKQHEHDDSRPNQNTESGIEFFRMLTRHQDVPRSLVSRSSIPDADVTSSAADCRLPKCAIPPTAPRSFEQQMLPTTIGSERFGALGRGGGRFVRGKECSAVPGKIMRESHQLGSILRPALLSFAGDESTWRKEIRPDHHPNMAATQPREESPDQYSNRMSL